jgi:CRISPR/Cas system-associated protein Cas7 (RAMP superfamily)
MKPVYNDELYHYGKLGMKWGHHKTGINHYQKELNGNQSNNYLENNKLRNKYDSGKISYEDYVHQSTQLGRKHIQKALDNAKKSALSSMSVKEQKQFKKQTDIGKKQADALLDKIARGGQLSLLDKVSLRGFK